MPWPLKHVKFKDEIRLKIKEKGEAYFDVKARPGAAKSQIVDEMADGSLKIDLAAAPERGKANDELIKLLAKELAVSKASIKIVAGKTDKKKLVKVEL